MSYPEVYDRCDGGSVDEESTPRLNKNQVRISADDAATLVIVKELQQRMDGVGPDPADNRKNDKVTGWRPTDGRGERLVPARDVRQERDIDHTTTLHRQRRRIEAAGLLRSRKVDSPASTIDERLLRLTERGRSEADRHRDQLAMMHGTEGFLPEGDDDGTTPVVEQVEGLMRLANRENARIADLYAAVEELTRALVAVLEAADVDPEEVEVATSEALEIAPRPGAADEAVPNGELVQAALDGVPGDAVGDRLGREQDSSGD